MGAKADFDVSGIERKIEDSSFLTKKVDEEQVGGLKEALRESRRYIARIEEKYKVGFGGGLEGI